MARRKTSAKKPVASATNSTAANEVKTAVEIIEDAPATEETAPVVHATEETTPAAPTADDTAPESPAFKLIVQAGNAEFDITDVIEKAYAAYKEGHSDAVTDFCVYVKPEDGAAYYTANGEGSPDYKITL